MRKEITKMGVGSVAKLYGAMYGVIGLIFGIFMALFASAMPSEASEELVPFTNNAGPIMLLIGLPIFYGILGLIAGAFGAFLYNIFAKFVGGIELEFKDVNEFE